MVSLARLNAAARMLQGFLMHRIRFSTCHNKPVMRYDSSGNDISGRISNSESADKYNSAFVGILSLKFYEM